MTTTKRSRSRKTAPPPAAAMSISNCTIIAERGAVDVPTSAAIVSIAQACQQTATTLGLLAGSIGNLGGRIGGDGIHIEGVR